MRVLLIANTLPPRDVSGVGEQVLQLAAGLRELGDQPGDQVEVLGRGAGGAAGPKVFFPLLVLPAVIPPALRFGTNNPVGQTELWLDGQAGRTYALQTSTNLLGWSSISTNTLSSNSFRFLVPVTNSAQIFYRGLLSQP